MTEQARTAIKAMQKAPKRTIINTDKPEEVVAKRSPTLDWLVGQGELTWRECAWCNTFLGYKEGSGTPDATTHGICAPCSEMVMAEMEEYQCLNPITD